MLNRLKNLEWGVLKEVSWRSRGRGCQSEQAVQTPEFGGVAVTEDHEGQHRGA